MRQGFSRELESLLRCADPIATEKIFAEVELRADYVRRKDQFEANTSVTPSGGINFLDDGIRLDDALSTKIENVSTVGSITDLDRDSPVSYAVLRWAGGDPAELEIFNVRCRLDPGGGGNDVVTWRMIMYEVVRREEGYLGATPAIWILPIAQADVANSGATLPGDFTFNFDGRPRPLRHHPTDFDDDGTDAVNVPTTWFQILALKADGTPATNGAWVSGGADVTTGGNVLTGRTAEKIAGDLGGVWRYTGTIAPPNMSVRTSAYVAATIRFDNPNWLDLGAVPTKTVRFETLELLPFGTSVTYEVRNDADTAFVTFKDGDTTADLSGVGLRQEYEIQITLTPNAGANLTPHVVSVGVKELEETDLSDVAELVQQSVAVDPITLKGSVADATLVAVRDGEMDFNDRITTVLAGNQLGAIVIRRFIGEDDLARDKWLHMDDWLLEDYELSGPAIVLVLISVIALLKRRLPPAVDVGGGVIKRTTLPFDGVTLKAAFEDLIQNQLLVPDRRFGPGIEDATTTVSTRIEDSDGKTECDAIAHLAGGALIASQGVVKFVDLLGEDKELVRRFVFEELAELSVTPGFRQRIPEFFVGFDFDFVKKRFKSEIRRFHGPALINLELAPVDAPDRLEDAPARWIDSQALAELVAQRTVDTLGTGMILFRIRSAYAYPELEPGDMVALETDRFVARDPNVSTRGLKGSLFVRGVIQEVDSWGRQLSVWIRSYADILSAAETVTVEGLAQPVVDAIVPNVSGVGDVSANVKTTDALSVKIAHSITGTPTRATVQGRTAIAVDSDGNLQTLLRNIAEGEELFIAALAYELAAGLGEESVDLYKVKSDQRETVIFGDVDVLDGFSAARNAGAPENGTVVFSAEGAQAFSNLEDANTNETTYRATATVDWNNGGSLTFLVFLDLHYSSAATGGTWILADTVSGDSTSGIEELELQAVAALDVDFDLRLTLRYSNPGTDGGKTQVTAHGEDGTPAGVQFKKKGVRVSSTRIVLPVGVDQWQIE